MARTGWSATSRPYVFSPGTSSWVRTAWTPGMARRPRVDRADPGARVRAAQRGAPDHVLHPQVGGVGELAGDLDMPSGRRTSAPSPAGPRRRDGAAGERPAGPTTVLIRTRGSAARPPGQAPAARRTASRIFSYPVQRHRLPASASRISASAGGDAPQQFVAAHHSPGVQNPHCTAPASESLLDRMQPSRRVAVAPIRPALHGQDHAAISLPGPTRQAHTALRPGTTLHDPHSPCSQAFFEPHSPSRSRRTKSRLSPSQTSSASAVDR